MPTYEFQCSKCDTVTERLFKIAERPDTVFCLKCGNQAEFIISCPMIQCDDLANAPWVREFAQNHNRQGGKRDRFGDKPIESRMDYKRYLERHDLRPTRGENLSEV